MYRVHITCLERLAPRLPLMEGNQGIRAVARTYIQGGQAEARGAKPIVKIF